MSWRVVTGCFSLWLARLNFVSSCFAQLLGSPEKVTIEVSLSLEQNSHVQLFDTRGTQVPDEYTVIMTSPLPHALLCCGLTATTVTTCFLSRKAQVPRTRGSQHGPIVSLYGALMMRNTTGTPADHRASCTNAQHAATDP